MWILLFAILIAPITVLADFICYIIRGKRLSIGIVDFFSYCIFPIVYLFFTDSGLKNDCCDNIVVFSPEHRLTIYFIIGVCMINYFYCFFREKSAPPIIEVVVNSILILAIALNIVIMIHLDIQNDWFFCSIGNIPIILLSILMLAKNQQRFIQEFQTAETPAPEKGISKWAWHILNASPFLKYPALTLLCLPLLVIIMIGLLLFGQKPDSLTRAFTDTYKHGFSQLDYECAGVVCGGHYLCTIAAKGHKNIVKPIRFGKRGNQTIICNRQLLVSNAFEDLLQQKFPLLHRFIRSKYDLIGDMVQKHYWLFNNKLISDLTYFLMKPLEWFFIFILYCCDKKPENRIARQYTDHHFSS